MGVGAMLDWNNSSSAGQRQNFAEERALSSSQ